MNPERCPTCGSREPEFCQYRAGAAPVHHRWGDTVARGESCCPDTFHSPSPVEGQGERDWIGCPDADVCQRCPCAAEDDACFPGERLRAELAEARAEADRLRQERDEAHSSAFHWMGRAEAAERKLRKARQERQQAIRQAADLTTDEETWRDRAEAAESALKLAKQDEYDAEQLLFASESALTRLLEEIRTHKRVYRFVRGTPTPSDKLLYQLADEIERSLGGPNASAEPEAQLADGKGAPADPPDKLARPPADVTRGGGVSEDAVAPRKVRGWGRYDGLSAAEYSDGSERPKGVGWFPVLEGQVVSRHGGVEPEPHDRVNERSDEDG